MKTYNDAVEDSARKAEAQADAQEDFAKSQRPEVAEVLKAVALAFRALATDIRRLKR